MKFFLCFLVLGLTISEAKAVDESDIGTILAGSTITFNTEVVIRANRDYFDIAERTDTDSDGSHYLTATCELKVKGDAVSYDRKISAGRLFIISRVDQDSDSTQHSRVFLTTGSFIDCYGWGHRAITIARFKSMLSDKNISLELNVPEL